MNIAKLLGPNVHPAFVSAASAPQFFHPRVGRVTRVFLSAGDREAYETGHGTYPGTPDMSRMGGPYGSGWYDAEQEQQDRDEAKAEAHADRMERE